MKWSKLKELTEERFAECLQNRVRLYATRYTSGSLFMARGWITIDGEEIASFSAPDNRARFGDRSADISEKIPHDEKERRANRLRRESFPDMIYSVLAGNT